MNPELPAEEEMKKSPCPSWPAPRAPCELCPVAVSNRSQPKSAFRSSSGGGADVDAGAGSWEPQGLGPLL